MKVAIIGAGIFGCTCAIRLGQNNITTTLYEEKEDIMMAASRVNQYRLHRGYHYPRSDKTVEQVKKGSTSFTKEYEKAIYNNCENLYAISIKDSHINSSEYLNFLNRNSLKYEVKNDDNLLVKNSCSLLIEAEESLINYKIQKSIVKERIFKNKLINLKLNTKYKKEYSKNYDFIVNCTYGMSNEILPESLIKQYKYQLLEKIVIEPPSSLRNKSLVIIDGPFMCIDPIPGTNLSILGNVKHAIHNTSIGLNYLQNLSTQIKVKPWTNIKCEDKSRFNKFILHAQSYINEIEKSKFIYSMIGFRVLIPGLEKTDERLTILNKDGKFINVFSGKIDTCSWAANELINLLKK
tara:strand:+ start:535 stop:1584 length:1050 start_codon:yes stop_codon:yes gene_type:complete